MDQGSRLGNDVNSARTCCSSVFSHTPVSILVLQSAKQQVFNLCEGSWIGYSLAPFERYEDFGIHYFPRIGSIKTVVSTDLLQGNIHRQETTLSEIQCKAATFDFLFGLFRFYPPLVSAMDMQRAARIRSC
ncbi:hypothetical protein SAMN05216417_102175 [Nitrosospira multiformis]|uniref:Uncharacterized protein n=1 Tax=Nitrosospira multiformis TaxID=1231 RepID=A0A1I7FSH5_9PROT|nr:hypothetical protein SAMN05216417_102175 [Nitrosospira multiformis]